MLNEHKTYHVSESRMVVYYTDTKKYWEIEFEPQDSIRNIQLYGKSYKGTSYHQQSELNARQKKEFYLHLKEAKTKKKINQWKQQLASTLSEYIFESCFPGSNVTKWLLSDVCSSSQQEINTMSFKELGITQSMLIEKMMSWNVLPQNFYQLK